MSRDDGFRVADHDPGFLHDRKVRRLRREAPNEGEGAIRTLLYLAVRDESWSDGQRCPVEDTDAPYEPTGERIAALQGVGLLDRTGRIPAGTWDNWFGPAWKRREDRRESGRKGGLAKARSHPPASGAVGSLEDRSTVALPVRSVPSVPTVPSVRSVPIKGIQEAKQEPGRAPLNGGGNPKEKKG